MDSLIVTPRFHLQIEVRDHSYYGIYTCHAQNELGPSEKTIELLEGGKFVILTNKYNKFNTFKYPHLFLNNKKKKHLHSITYKQLYSPRPLVPSSLQHRVIR